MERVDQEKDQLGEQLIHAGRLAEIGEMSAGFAHEINNPLQIIKSEYTLVEMILAELKEYDGKKQRPSIGGGSCRKSCRFNSGAGFVL